jgi:hypothetical protein
VARRPGHRAVVAVGSVVLIVVQVGVFALHPAAGTVEAFLALMTRDPLLGLVSLDLLYSVNNVLVALVHLALAVLLRRMPGPPSPSPGCSSCWGWRPTWRPGAGRRS